MKALTRGEARCRRLMPGHRVGRRGVRRCYGTHDGIVVGVWMHRRELRIWVDIVESQCMERLMHIEYRAEGIGAYQGELRIWKHIVKS